MRRRGSILPYLVLNVIVSAATILLVLWLWERAHPTPTLPYTLPTPIPGALATQPSAALTPQQSTPLPPGAEQPGIVIESVIGMGDVNSEVLLLKRTGDGELTLTGWQLVDSEGNTYIFPGLTLYKGGAVQVHSGLGVNSVVDLYWGRDAPVWSVGEKISLLDSTGTLVASYTIP